MDEISNCYEILGCPENSSIEEVRKKYKQLALKVRNRQFQSATNIVTVLLDGAGLVTINQLLFSSSTILTKLMTKRPRTNLNKSLERTKR